MNEQPLIECKNLTKSYTTGTEALSHVSLTVGRGKIVGLLGPNGSGKTTLIKLLSGLLTPTQGDVCIDGHAPGIYTKSIVSYLPDRMYFPKWMRVNDILAFFADFYPDFDRKKALDMLSSLGIAPGEKIRRLSKGTQEKVQLVLVMSRKAQLYLMDEPIAGVDPAARDFILNTILTNYNEEGTVLLSTHLISDIERVLDEVIFLQNGHLVRQDSVDRIRETEGKSVDALFRDIFRTPVYPGYTRKEA
ncbi:MAG TPA: ABC transporter ATP-binding protein [Firmicutes bacterium]|nr:ABC transporter ATP-binding protein [Bacillota bacterium]